VNPHGSALSSDGRYLFVSSNGPGGMTMGGMAMGAGEHGAAEEHREGHDEGGEHDDDADGADAPAETGSLTVIDTRDGSVVKVLEMGANTTGVGTRAR
jgi:hypothetical protein